VPRALMVNVGAARTVAVDAIGLSGGFDLNFYRQFVRDQNESPNLQLLRRWTKAPNVYIQTSALVDMRQLDLVEAVARESIPNWTGGRFGVASVERGTETRRGVAGWLTVTFSAETGHCGLSDVGAEGGSITLYPNTAGCGCDGYKTRPQTIRHEFGHAMGFYHTDSPTDVMMLAAPGCDNQSSARERAHAAIAYARPVGNVDPDDDTRTATILSLPRVTVY
jgi:Metallo-peptidase family M12B Reprolysin-like